jgi:hypothetical protein
MADVDDDAGESPGVVIKKDQSRKSSNSRGKPRAQSKPASAASPKTPYHHHAKSSRAGTSARS